MEILNQPGESLRSAREKAGLTLSDVVHQTRFPRTVVEALERDDYTIFPSPTYARSYLSQYAEFLGVDPTKWLAFFEPAAFTGPQDVLSMIESPVHQEARPLASGTRSNSGSGSMLPSVLLILLSVGLIYGVITGYGYLETKFGGASNIKSRAPAITPVTKNPAAPTPAAAVTATPEAPIAIPPAAPPTEATPPPRATIIREVD